MPVIPPHVPRSVTAALWLPYVRDLGTAHAAGRAVTGDDEPHVALLGNSRLGWPGLVAALAPIRRVIAVLPVPGDPAGAPAEAVEAATEAGECVLVAGESTYALVPEIRGAGARASSGTGPGAFVTWHVTALDQPGPALAAELLPPAEAYATLFRSLVECAVEAQATLSAVEPGVWDGPNSPLIAAFGAGSPEAGWGVPLPPDVEPYRVRAISLASYLRHAVAPHAAGPHLLTGRKAARRAGALRDVDSTARRVITAATLWAADGAR